MKLKVLFCYTEDIIPPRCRKPRPVHFNDGEIEVEIREVSAAEAPVAIRSEGEFTFRKNQHYSVEYRWFDDQLWTSLNIRGAEPRGTYANQDNWDWPAFPPVLDIRFGTGNSSYDHGYYESAKEGSRSEVEQRIREWANSHLLIDGVPHRPTGEPRYVAMTFGLGRNHGGTAVMVDDHYNSNIAKTCYFSLLERDKAIELATKFATERGDTESLPIKPHGPTWEILMPEAIQVKPSVQHGDGDPFLNGLQAMTMAAGGAPVVGLVAAMQAAAG